MIHTLAHLILFAASALALMAIVVAAGKAGLSLASRVPLLGRWPAVAALAVFLAINFAQRLF